jgi:GT2 family glycosyltransferase
MEVDRTLTAYDFGHGDPYPSPGHAAWRPFAPCAGAAAYRREAFLAVGGFDEAIFAYLEDIDLGVRMRLAGMDCALAYDAWAWHEGSGTLGSGSPAKNRLMGRSRRYLVWKWGRSMAPADRARGIAVDAAILAGQAVVDRTLAGLRGRLRGGAPSGGARPPAAPGFAALPFADIGVRGALRRRLLRRPALAARLARDPR